MRVLKGFMRGSMRFGRVERPLRAYAYTSNQDIALCRANVVDNAT